MAPPRTPKDPPRTPPSLPKTKKAPKIALRVVKNTMTVIMCLWRRGQNNNACLFWGRGQNNNALRFSRSICQVPAFPLLNSSR